jgi:hypothetical protein
MRILGVESIPVIDGSGNESGRPIKHGSGIMVHLHHSSKMTGHKKVTKQKKIKVFSYFFCLMMKGSGSVFVTKRSDADPGGPKIYGSF